MKNIESSMMERVYFHQKVALDSKNRPICNVEINGQAYSYYLGPDANGIIFSNLNGEYISVGKELRWWRGIIDRIPDPTLLSALNDFGFSIIKSDALERGLDRIIRDNIEGIGLNIKAEKEITMDRESLFRLYPYFFEESWEKMLVGYFCSSSMICLLITGQNATTSLIKIRDHIRSAYRNHKEHPIINLFHAADSQTDAFREANLFFHENELIKIIGQKK